jgi:repressor LexA
MDTAIAVDEDIRCDFALRVVGDSMINARIQDGDIVFIREQRT